MFPRWSHGTVEEEGALVVVVDQLRDAWPDMEVVEDSQGLRDVDRVECLRPAQMSWNSLGGTPHLVRRGHRRVRGVPMCPAAELGGRTNPRCKASDADWPGASGWFRDKHSDQGLVPRGGQNACVDDGVVFQRSATVPTKGCGRARRVCRPAG